MNQYFPLFGSRSPFAFFVLILLTFSFPAIAQIKPTPAADRMKTVQQRRLLEEKSLVKDITFQNIGPSIMSGRVVDLDVNPEDPTEFYVAYATGGLWYTHNNGQSFEPVFDQEDVIVLGDIAVNWNNNPSTRTIWVGTGEVNSSRSSYAGIGMYKTSNGGKSWNWIGLPESQHIGKIVLHPTDKNTAWVAVLGHLYSPNKERGVYKTTDGGKTWKQTLYIDENTGVVDLDINPQDPSQLYACAWYRTRRAWDFEESGASGGIFKSMDGGETWKLLTTASSGFPTGKGLGRIGVAVAPNHPAVVYAVLDNNFHKPDTATKKKDSTKYSLSDFEKLNVIEFLKLDDKKLDSFLKDNHLAPRYTSSIVKDLVKKQAIKPTAIYDYLFDANTALFETPIIGCEVYRSDDSGISWKKTNQKEINFYNTYGYYFGKIYVSPRNENKLFILGFNLQSSDDGGKTFHTIDQSNVHPDHHAFWVDPARDSHIIDGNDGGVNISYDNGEHWFKANTPPVGQFYSVTTDNAKPYNVYGGLQDNGIWYGPSTYTPDPGWINDGKYPYLALMGGDGMQVQVDTRDNRTVYGGFQFGFYQRQTYPDGKSKRIRPHNDLGKSKLRFNWQTPIFLSRHNQDVLYYGSNKFHRSLNQGDSLVTLSGDLTNGGKEGDIPFGTITTISESPLRFGLLYAGTDDGNVQLSRDGGNTWTNIGTKLPQGLWVSRVLASGFKEGRVFVTLNGYRNDHFLPYLFMSEDYGANWKQLGKDLPFEPLNVIKEDPTYDSILYAGSDGGLYVSIDMGNSFMMWNKGLPKSIPVHDIAIQQRENEIVLGTHGRSLFVSKLDSVQLLLKNDEYRMKRQKLADNAVSIMRGENTKDLFSREGIEVECPDVNVSSKARRKKR